MNLYTIFHDTYFWILKILHIHSVSSGLKVWNSSHQTTVAAKALFMWHFPAQVSFKGASPFIGLSNPCLLSCFPNFSNCLSPTRNHGPHSMTLHNEERQLKKRAEKKNLCKFCWLHEYTNTKRRSHLEEFYTMPFNIPLSTSVKITQSISMELLRIFSPVWEKKHVSLLNQWIYNLHITD